jgi:hypothetical protein
MIIRDYLPKFLILKYNNPIVLASIVALQFALSRDISSIFRASVGLSVFLELFLRADQWYANRTLNLLTADQSKTKAILYCTAESDHNGAFEPHASGNVFSVLKQFTKDHSIVHKKVGSIWAINQAIDELATQGKKITTLWIGAHGAPDSILLKNDHWEGVIGPNSELIDFNKLTSNAKIVLQCCSSGGALSKYKLNIAQNLSLRCSPRQKIIAPQKIIRGWDINIKTDQKLTTLFHDQTLQFSRGSTLQQFKTL